MHEFAWIGFPTHASKECRLWPAGSVACGLFISCTPDSVCRAELVGQCTDWWTLGPLDPDDVTP